MYTHRVRHLTQATHPRFKGKWEWAILTEDGHEVDRGLAATEREARAAADTSLPGFRRLESAAYWLDRFNAPEDGHALGGGLTMSEVGKYGISIDQLDAMIEAAKACRHADELHPEIEDWRRLLALKLDRDEAIHRSEGKS